MKTLPEELWFGTTEGQWPIHCWESEAHALTFLASNRLEPGQRRRIWKAKVVDPVLYDLVTPEPFLRVVER